MKMMLTTMFAGLLLVGCSTDNVNETENGLYCYEGYSYVRIGGTVVPSPETLDGYVDYDCPQP